VSTADLQIKSLSLAGPAGRLEALLNLGASQPTHTALVCHPHPLGGGTLHNKVVFHTMKALHGFGMPVLRFNFRGTGLSEGEHDEGRGEVDDTRTVLDWLAREFSLPVVFAGFSFGAAVGLRACYDDARVPALIALGTPVGAVEGRTYDFSFLADCPKPKLFLSGDRDQYGPRTKLEALVTSLPEPVKLTLIPGADHFFAGRLAEMRLALEDWVESELGLTKAV
jgi:uncharacterized protein